MGMVARFLAAIGLVTLSISSWGAQFVRWTNDEQSEADLSSIVAELNRRTGFNFCKDDFEVTDDRDLAYSHYTRLLQVKLGLPVDKASLRIWRDRSNGTLLQVEANIEDPSQLVPLAALKHAATKEASAHVKRTIESHAHMHGAITNIARARAWLGFHLVEIVTITTSKGVTKLTIDAESGRLREKAFKPHPSRDQVHEFSVPTRAYPVYEEYNGHMLEAVPVELKYLNDFIRLPTSDPYAQLREQHFYSKKHDVYRAKIPQGRAEGYWSFSWLYSEIERLAQMIAPSNNSFDNGGLFLDGRYATVSIHPSALSAFGPISFEPHLGEHVLYDWREDQSVEDWEVIPKATYRGKPWQSMAALHDPDIVRDANHNPQSYIESGFDEIQVYYSITTLFERLRAMGFVDPDLSEKPFHAFLYHPDIEWKNNAFYTNDTINFTTYSPNEVNMARDNTTIWHELGHGVMDRLMGADLNLADTGGLSEGMADFVALLVLEATTNGTPFLGSNDQRIINNTGFFLTNEVHDDGEAYGGAMKQILDSALASWGREGLVKVTDLVLEAMRLSRDHPHLTADDWFERVRFADQMGRANVRAPFELRSIIDNALVSRNFGSEEERVTFSLRYEDNEVVAGSNGSRDNEILASLDETETATYPLTVRIADGTSTKLQYPVTAKVVFNGGALQGAIDWVGEDFGPQIIRLDAPAPKVDISLAIKGSCDAINREDGSCSDYAYIQIFENGTDKPIGKKRFYLKLKTKEKPADTRLNSLAGVRRAL